MSDPRAPRSPYGFPFFYGWAVVGVAFVTLAIAVNTRTTFSLLFPPILAEFGWERGTTAAAFSCGFLAAIVYAPFVGTSMHSFGPRVVIPVSAVLVSIGMVAMTFVTQPWHLYLAFGVLVGGASSAASYLGHSVFLPFWFVRQRGRALGIAFSGVGVGSIVLFPWFQRVINQAGWRQACWLMAGVLLAVVLPMNILFQRRRPEDLGLEPDGGASASTTRTAHRPDDYVVDRAWAATDWTLGRAVRTTRFWWLGVSFFSSLYAWYAIQVHQTKYLTDKGFSPETAAYALALVGFTACGGQIALGVLSDRIGREWVWTISMAGFVLCYVILLAMPERPDAVLLYAMVAAQGMLGYGTVSVFGAIPAEIFQGRHYGRIYGSLTIFGSLGGASGPLVTGFVFDVTNSYAAAFWLGLASACVSIAAMWRAGPRHVRVVAGQVDRLARRRAVAQSS